MMTEKQEKYIALELAGTLLLFLFMILYIGYLKQSDEPVRESSIKCSGFSVRNVETKKEYEKRRRGKSYYLDVVEVKDIELYDGRKFEIRSDSINYEKYMYISSGDILNEECGNDLRLTYGK